MKENFRPVSILPTLSKVFEKCKFTKLSTFLITFFRTSIAVFEKDIVFKVFGALLTDLSKAFDCLDHELTNYLLQN